MKYLKKYKLFESDDDSRYPVDKEYIETLFSDLEDEGISVEVNPRPLNGFMIYLVSNPDKYMNWKDIKLKIHQVLSVIDEKLIRLSIRIEKQLYYKKAIFFWNGYTNSGKNGEIEWYRLDDLDKWDPGELLIHDIDIEIL